MIKNNNDDKIARIIFSTDSNDFLIVRCNGCGCTLSLNDFARYIKEVFKWFGEGCVGERPKYEEDYYCPNCKRKLIV